jgi:hypothetical protein
LTTLNNVIAEFPQFPVSQNYGELRTQIFRAIRED